jgi:hypothetical protein
MLRLRRGELTGILFADGACIFGAESIFTACWAPHSVQFYPPSWRSRRHRPSRAFLASGLFSCRSIFGFSDLSSSKRRAGAVLRSRMGVLIQTLKRLPSDLAGRGASFTRKTKPWRTPDAKPEGKDRRSIRRRQKYVRFTRARTGFEPVSSLRRSGRAPALHTCDYPSNPCLWALCFIVARGDAAAFRRARFGLSSSERSLCHNSESMSRNLRKIFFHERRQAYPGSAFSVCEKDDTRVAYSNERWGGRPCLSLRALPRALRPGRRAALRGRGASRPAARASVPRHWRGCRGEKSRSSDRARARS